MQKIERIIISADLTRVTEKLQPFHDARIEKYFQLLNWQLSTATNLPVERLKSNSEGWNTEKFYSFFGKKLTSNYDWVSVYDVKNIPEEAIKFYQRFVNNSLVIYIEASQTIKRIHDALGVPYIDITVHPIRYLDDHLFGMASNDEKIRRIFSQEKEDPRRFAFEAGMICAQAAQSPLKIQPNSLLVIGQTELDKSLIRGRKLVKFSDFQNKIKDLASRYDHVYFKPHPYRKNNNDLINALERITEVIQTNENIYKLLSSRDIKAVVGISSSSIYESRYFGKGRNFLAKVLKFDFEGPQDDTDVYYSIGDKVFNPLFWSKVISELGVKCSFENYQPPHVPNRIRAALNDFWAQTDMDPSVRIGSKFLLPKLERIQKGITKDSSNEPPVLKTKKAKLAYYVTRTLDKFPFTSGLSDLLVFKALGDKLKKKRRYIKTVDKQVHCISYRPAAPNGGRGGAGAVMSAMKKIIGSKLADYSISYTFSEKDGVWHTQKNKFYNLKTYPIIFTKNTDLMILWSAMAFVYDCCKNRDEVYITHEFGTAYALSLLGKKYALVVHSQGPRLEEKKKLGERINWISGKILQYCEKQALLHASSVYFPSNGAKDSFFNSKYCILSKDQVKIGRPLYNTLYVEAKPEPFDLEIRLDGRKILLSVGTCTEAKGFDKTVEFVTNLAKQNKDVNFVWLWVGKGPLEEKVASMADKASKELPNFEYVHYRALPYAKVQYLMEIADCYVMLHRKSIFDLATLEAMKSSCALMLSPLEGNLEFNVQDNVFFVQPASDFLWKEDEMEGFKHKNKEAYEKFFGNNSFKSQYQEVIEGLFKD